MFRREHSQNMKLPEYRQSKVCRVNQENAENAGASDICVQSYSLSGPCRSVPSSSRCLGLGGPKSGPESVGAFS